MKATCFIITKNQRSTEKKKLKASLSLELEHRSRSSSSAECRSRSHSVSSNQDDFCGISPRNRLALDSSCLHCSFSRRNQRKQLQDEIERATSRLRRNLGEFRLAAAVASKNVHEQQSTSVIEAPDIVISSVSSEDDLDNSTKYMSNEMDSVTSSITRCYFPVCYIRDVERFLIYNFSSIEIDCLSITPSSSTCPSPQIQTLDNYFSLEASSMDLRNCIGTGLTKRVECGVALISDRRALLSADLIATLTPTGLRSNSIDLSTLRREIECLNASSEESSDNESISNDSLSNTHDSTRATRSRSYDPTALPQHILRRPSRIEHLSDLFRRALAKSPMLKRTAAMQVNDAKSVCKHRTSRYWLDDQLGPAEHIWLPSSGPGSAANSSHDTECYIGEKDCEKVGEKRRCAACHIVAHTACFSHLSKMNLNCKITYREAIYKKQSRSEVTEALNRHHWIHRWKHEGRCGRCGKSFQHRMFRDKEVIAITCSWCKRSYHNKQGCFSAAYLEERCDRGVLSEMIVPPTMQNEHSSVSCSRHFQYRPFIVKPLEPSLPAPSQPLLVFVNPKSGGNKGSKALHTLCWLLNPRQVFDITSMKGPKYGLEMFRKVIRQLRMLVCGGDGTVGWVLGTLDQLNWPTYPPMALLPLGTGNDLSRCMGWGGSFTDEPLSQLLKAILHETSITHLDRWQIDVESLSTNQSDLSEELNEAVQSTLPLTVMNNYFSIGADAHVALQFHHSRSANPQMLNSRLKNRIAYGGLGTIDLFKRTWKDLSEFVTLECDHRDFTPKIKEFKFHCILFHNIAYYAGGTIPWGNDDDETTRPSSCDGKIEVLGFTTATLAALQMGGKGERIAQCSSVRMTTTKPIPMQVDGEPCLLAPSIITLKFHSKVPMLRREKKVVHASNREAVKPLSPSANSQLASTSLIMQMPVLVIGRNDFNTYRDAFERLRDSAYEIGVISVEAETELNLMRHQIQKLLHEHSSLPYEPGDDWRFLDYVTNAEEGTFRIARHQEHTHSVSDVCNLDDCLMILDEHFPSVTSRSSILGSDLTFDSSASTDSYRKSSTRRISDTVRIVLSSDTQETLL
ncbi:unnamed protein product [Anisakis simplex]|uniref:Diacylglycerol kinase n=1 Tax=Anisakis simplex TaxID=6269 RepID=A0A0M3JQY9_ANISI|nr:unnamed protein product [Anisakis simplex]